MKLTDINLKGYGNFCDEKATFRCSRYALPRPWDYVYTNGNVLLRIKHNGCGFLQIEPPGDTLLLNEERLESTPSMHCWLIPEKGSKIKAFSNFWQPILPVLGPSYEPEEYTCTFSPEAARYYLLNNSWLIETEVWVPLKDQAVIMTVKITNRSSKTRSITLMPVVKPYMAQVRLAPWDVPHNYQTAAFTDVSGYDAVMLEARDPGGDPSKRIHAAVITDLNCTAYEVSYDRFTGNGSWVSPRCVWDKELFLKKEKIKDSVIGQRTLAAFKKRFTLKAGSQKSFTVVYGRVSDNSSASILIKYINKEYRNEEIQKISLHYNELMTVRLVNTPDESLNRYTNEWLPMQLYWVGMLDRGWCTGMRGTRDASQDTAGIIPVNYDFARKRIKEIFSLQRSDGWFLRQYSIYGKQGQHDRRNYVDSGIWVWELLWQYLCWTRDFSILNEKLPWLDINGNSTVLTHAIRILEYYINKENIGEHGLCKIREGDWLDAVNRAGLEGRGETVMVSCQVVLGLKQGIKLLSFLVEQGYGRMLLGNVKKFKVNLKKLCNSLRKYALNKSGYYNGVFNDAGRWIFSPADPDGKKRISCPANSFAIISGIAKDSKEKERIFKALNSLKGPYGWRVFYPAISGNPPIEKLGRIGQGDLAPGLGENGTPYNHGSHGFLGRAAWTAGRGNMLYDILRYMLPYDQKTHPVEVTQTAPYGVVNHWKEASGLKGVGGDVFLSGSITTAIRNIYDGIIGFRPELKYLVIDPSIPSGWKNLSARIPFLGGNYEIKIKNPDGVECGVQEILIDEKFLLKSSKIPIHNLPRLGTHTIEVLLG